MLKCIHHTKRIYSKCWVPVTRVCMGPNFCMQAGTGTNFYCEYGFGHHKPMGIVLVAIPRLDLWLRRECWWRAVAVACTN